ncbi:hypothetical protein FEM48_Zijuj10G0012100 [Ziziphus jujuba var. spinosa]|uniref:DC1 domain-containing protein n=1 Tax=Ziziphus jujuba var. spinosa TaxID=714518 RepID=A0A978UKE8_ZIZJJ|nr:hypothetical protein FEM48_Zijuj10G0012100 [Ziziphus jujuba var. spinosa]
MYRPLVGRRAIDTNHPSHHHPLREWDRCIDINHPSHNYPLRKWDRGNINCPEIICRGCNRDSADVYCRRGRNRDSADVYCPEEGCEYFLHTFCADLGRLNKYPHVDHPLHPQHPLTLYFDSFPNDQTEFVCSFCKETKTSGCFLFHCAHCDFYLDFYCALNFQSEKTLLSQYQFPHFLHPYRGHTYSPYCSLDYVIKNVCRACGLNIGYNELVLKCSGFNCMYYLHVHFFRIPKEMKHPLHPQHTLALLEGPPPAKVVNPSIILRNIRSDISSTSFHCNACCSRIRENGFRDRCAVCNALFSTSRKVYCCVDCNFNVHKACLSLPLNVDYEDHVHTFTLITSFNEDEDELHRGKPTLDEPKIYRNSKAPIRKSNSGINSDEKQLVSQLDMKIEKIGEMLKQLLDERHRENVTEKLDKLEKSNAEAEGMLRQLRELMN